MAKKKKAGKTKAPVKKAKKAVAKKAPARKAAPKKPAKKASKPEPKKTAPKKLEMNKPVERPQQVYNLFEDLETQELIHMLSLKPAQRFAELRRFINTAYRMRGYDPDSLPKKRRIVIVSK